MTDSSFLGATLKYFRKKSGLTQAQLSKTLGITRSSYAYYESGKSTPKLEVLQKLAALYNVTLETIVEGKITPTLEQDPEFFYELHGFDDKFYDLTDVEKAVILKLRIMSREKRKDILEEIFD